MWLQGYACERAMAMRILRAEAPSKKSGVRAFASLFGPGRSFINRAKAALNENLPCKLLIAWEMKLLVPKKGLEPPHPCEYVDLNHARLPIPPLRHEVNYYGQDECQSYSAARKSILQTRSSLSNHGLQSAGAGPPDRAALFLIKSRGSPFTVEILQLWSGTCGYRAVPGVG